MDTNCFRTPQEIVAKKNVCQEGCWLLGIDAGFSSVKGYAPNKYFCFPSFVKKVENMIPISGEDDILYRDETGTYLVGRSAQDQVSFDDTSDTDSEMFSRNRYSSKKFEVLIMTGVGIGLSNNKIRQRQKDQPIVVQTGLPTAYLVKKDIDGITNAFSKHYTFSLKISGGQWKDYDIKIERENVYVMAQPSGTLYSVMIDEDGRYLSDAKRMLMRNLLIVDAGFQTFDPYALLNRKLVLKESIPNVVMRHILEETSDLIYRDYGEKIRLPVMQRCLEKGKFMVLDEENMKMDEVDLAPYLVAANEKVCRESIEILKGMSNFMRDYDIMILTGGTGAAWFEMYKDYFKEMKNLEVLPGNRNDGLPMIYSNVRGYYMLRYMIQKAGGKTNEPH